uniref:KOW domain-containing protein n=1 Tax=Lotharella oceanica TaxID=641309 RepID=A0A7S2THC0_9EUKA
MDAKPDRVTVKKEHVKLREEVEQNRQRRQEVHPYLGRETPLIGSRTPRRDDGGRTPIHDSALQDGSMTPGPVPSTPSSDAFNPAAYADDDNNEIYTPAPEDAQTPRTPLTAPGTTTTPYTPQTNPLSPYPGGDGGVGEAPFTAGPSTPVTPTPNTPYTPGVQDEDEQGDGGLPTDVAVMYNGQRGVVRGGNNNGYEVEFQGGERRTITESKLQLIRPSKAGVQVKIIRGPRRGQIGKILSSSEGNLESFVQLDDGMVVVEAARLAEYVPA